MKILVIDEEFPYPLNTGKRIRSFHLTNALARRHQVSYLAYGCEGTPEFDFMRDSGLGPIAVKPPNRRKAGPAFYLRLLLNLASPYPYIVTSHYTRRFQDKLNETVKGGRYDCVVCEWTPYAIFIRHLQSAKKVIVAHNIESSIWKGYLARERNFFKKLYIVNQARKVERFESRCFTWTDGATAVTGSEAARIRSLGVKSQVEVIENGVDLSYFEPRECEQELDTLVFTGSMDWRPNKDAAVYFVGEIFPLIRKRRPQAKAFFVGRDPSRKIKDLEKTEGIRITGTVDDVRPFIDRGAVYIVPLRIGGGSRLKILEAMAMRKAVVSTSIGAEGLQVKDGMNIIIADAPEEFAAAVIRCLEDRALRDRIAANGRKVVEQHYRWEELGKRYSDYLSSIVGAR